MLFRRLEAVKNAPSISWAVHEITSYFGYQKSPPLIAKGLKNILSNTHLIISLGMSAACLPSSHCGLSGVALRRVTVAIGLYSVRLSEGSGPAVYKASNYYQFPDRWEEFVRRLLSMCLRHACAQVDHGNMKSLGLFGICASWYASLRGETGSNWFLAQELNLLLKAHEACDLTVYSARNTARILLPSALRLFGGRIT